MTRDGRFVALALAVALSVVPVAGGLRPGAQETPSATPAPPPPVPNVADPERCRGCHPSQVAEWRASPHARAAATEGFLAALRRYAARLHEHPPTIIAGRCLGCHVPLADAPANVASRLLAGRAARGVTCAACHDGTSTAHPTRYPPGVTPAAPARACAGCHSWEPPAVACSTVFDGWLASPAAAAGATCETCHMPAGSHRFEGSRSAAMLRRAAALSVVAESSPEGPVAFVEVRNLAGHRVPDG